MVRTIVIPDDTHIQLDVPADYVGKKVEVNVFLIDEINPASPKKTMADFWGILSDKTANELHEKVNKSRDEWERDI
ncbi:hypothetical protein [Mucilaginibacter gotjawali]|uniref:MoxR-like ATPase n=1 Tax=Mucilaginibacter gotjawali TaxID=1550579 RepID=A0A839SB56_9SPHI|nr:hypothetical protein [Mucilaginibacter gotjawali]MBB3054594.1 MoxR-like ATPase [Mucilaginibacter gotjawali]